MAQSPTPRVEAGETTALAVSFAYFFCVLSAYYVIRPVREQLSADGEVGASLASKTAPPV